jgi:hypothetical protein
METDTPAGPPVLEAAPAAPQAAARANANRGPQPADTPPLVCLLDVIIG